MAGSIKIIDLTLSAKKLSRELSGLPKFNFICTCNNEK
jgi:hypothetical protein